MHIINGLDRLPRFQRRAAIAIGNFDGLHLGHQKILRFLVQSARKHHLCSLVLTFSPHPENVLGRSRVCLIQTLHQRLEGIESFGVQHALVTAFDREFSSLSGEEFVHNILVDALGAKVVIVGENFRFGKGRSGNCRMLCELGIQLGFAVHCIPAVRKRGYIVSSSLIRGLLLEGNIELANEFLDGAYEIEGRVIKGESRGKSLGYPTANIETANEIKPSGVFITTVSFRAKTHPALTNIGFRPTFPRNKLTIESFLLDFQGNLYERKVTMQFYKKIRDEKKFESAEALASQIQQDLEIGREFFIKKKLAKNA